MPRTKSAPGQMNLLEAKTSTAPCASPPFVKPCGQCLARRWLQGCQQTRPRKSCFNHLVSQAEHRLPNGRKFELPLRPARSDGNPRLSV